MSTPDAKRNSDKEAGVSGRKKIRCELVVKILVTEINFKHT